MTVLERHVGETFEELVYPGAQLNVAAFSSIGAAHGPGLRTSVWLQGCMKRCVGCTNPEMLTVEEVTQAKTLMTAEELLRRIRRSRDSVGEVRGLTLQGGEPVLQARNLIPVLEALRAESPMMDVILFTGYRLGFLQQLGNEAITRLLELVDVVIDGEYRKSERDLTTIAGSRNQTIHHLTDRLSEESFARQPQERSIAFGSGGVGEVVTGVNI
ncbi:radical SAM protein [Candidatus Peregrinibacteria bacterium]|jgi:anaerobic ribonucleoside-triphosphate reductase activating protein|nr:radical SAM protein [Candidatus Peregrinibacteria bacterium]